MAELIHITHPIKPIYDEYSRVLMLGTMPSPASREAGIPYAHPRNRFWPVLATLLDEPLPESVEGKRAMVLRHHIAIWDVIASCDIAGASDASIRNAVGNDFTPLLKTAPIKAIFTTGTKATQLYRKLCEPMVGRPCIGLPSTSPAHAAMSFDQLLARYRVILDYL